VTEPPVPQRVITDLSRIEVRRISPFPTSGAAHWVSGRWVIVLNAAEPVSRQRFSLAHEFKHILDHHFVRQLYGAIDPLDRGDWGEQVCDYFAGCLLMPRPWLKRAWAAEQNLGQLARSFHVSQAAMSTRLSQVGLRVQPRCGHQPSSEPHRLRPAPYERRLPSPAAAGSA
jgi:Zn-dependent peptidase ImmA (M78 family)